MRQRPLLAFSFVSRCSAPVCVQLWCTAPGHEHTWQLQSTCSRSKPALHGEHQPLSLLLLASCLALHGKGSIAHTSSVLGR